MTRLIVLVAALAAMLGTARLGLWQLDRAAQKTSLQQALERQRALPALEASALPADLAAADVAPLVHRAVLLAGTWRADASVYLDNRQMNGVPGFFVLTPLALDDGRVVLVQRGWTPRDPADRTRIAAPPPPAGRVEIAGRIAAEPSRLFEFAPAAEASGPIRQNLDLAAFARERSLKLLPLVVVQEEGTARPPTLGQPVDDGLKRQWPVPASDVHKHYGYAFQWFALSALVLGLYVWFQLLRPRLRRQAVALPGGADGP
jgi:surfeit locus 1 family protein